MLIDKIPVGKNPPWDINVIIEIPMGGIPVKYELDKKSGAMFVDRLLHTAMYYPGNYGFIPHTLSSDGDPVDVLVAGRTPVMTGSIMAARPLGVVFMEDEAGLDEKIICVPVDRLHPYYRNTHTYHDLPQIWLDQVTHFFNHYKDLEIGKWVKISHWGGPQDASLLIEQAIKRAQLTA